MQDNNEVTLDYVALNKLCVVNNLIKINNTQVNRMYDFGIVKGASIVPINNSMFGDTRAYLIKGCVVALRQQDAKYVNVSINNGGNYAQHS